jgi:predicted CXXCH cytochrome family protein
MGRMTLRARSLLAATWLVLAVQASGAQAGNPHNVGFCASCHPVPPRFGVDTRRDVSFTTSADDPGLCWPCHSAGRHSHPVLIDAGSGPVGARTSAYLPAGMGAWAGKIVCTSCHFIHAADDRHRLLRGFPGSPDPRYFSSAAAFCEECHGANLAARSAHGGGEGSCVSCHAGQPGQGRLADAPPVLRERCVVCHRRVKGDHYDNRTPFGRREECLQCHDHHAVSSVSPGLLSEAFRTAAADSVVIRPHFSRSLCFACHENIEDYALRNEDVNALCDRCHASGKISPNIHPLRKVPPKITVPKGWPLSGGALTCLTCHDQGHEDQPQRRWMLHGGPYDSPREVCRNCHGTTDLEKSRIHQEINEGKSCEMCHRTRPKPGTDTIKTVTFIADPDLLCLRCHDQSAADGSVHHAGVIGRQIDPDQLPVSLPLFQGRVICATCHNPHQLEVAEMRLRAALDTSHLCVGCHRK